MTWLALATLLMGASPSAWRLPATVAPSHYRISLDLDVENERFSGDETIEISIAEPTSQIVLNSLDLEIRTARLRQAEMTLSLDVAYDVAHERIILRAPRTIDVGEAALDLEFSGDLKEGLRGIYLSRSGDDVYVATQQQATYARMMFPCFDEPAMKATYTMEVIVDAESMAISNGPVIAEEVIRDSGRKRVRFGKSPVMSTYLVALAAGRFDCLTDTVGDVPVRVCGRPEKKRELAFAMDVTREVLGFFKDWYGIAYPFGKLDLVALPDYEWGGMENTAAIYFREVYLLVDPETSSPARRQRVARLVAHEIAHQWFGDLVTTAWWDDIWLNEGFATWMTPKAVASFREDWARDEEAAANAQSVMTLDSLESTRPIHGTASTPDEIKEMFDGIAYTKGAAIIRMLESWVGEETFRKGVNVYLEAHANGSARSADLWEAVSSVSERNVGEIMPTFVNQAGIPVVTMTTRMADGATDIVLGQQRFLTNGGTSKVTWKVPVCLRVGLDDGTTRTVCELLADRTATVKIPGDVEWILGNAGAKGYYRVGWSEAQLHAIVRKVPGFEPSERLSILEDAWAMTQSGQLGIDAFLDLASIYEGEQNQIVIESLAAAIGRIRRALIGNQVNPGFDAWTRGMFSALAEELGATAEDGEGDERRALRGTVLSILADAGDEEVLAALETVMTSYLEDPAGVDPSIAEVAFDAVPARGDAELFAKLESTLERTKSTQTYDLCLRGLTQFRDPELVDRAVGFPGTGKLRLDRFPGYYEALLRNASAREKTWAAMKADWPELQSKVVSFGGRGAIRAIGSFCSPELRDDVKTFFAKNDAPGAERALALSLEQVDTCIRFRQTQDELLRTWLTSGEGSEVSVP